MSHPYPTMDVVLLNGEGYKEVNIGELHKIGLPVVPEGESQTLSQGGEVLYR